MNEIQNDTIKNIIYLNSTNNDNHNLNNHSTNMNVDIEEDNNSFEVQYIIKHRGNSEIL